MITSKSIQHSNITCVFNEQQFVTPDNMAFQLLFTGEIAKGMRFLDDPVIGAKVLTLPQLKIKVVLEGRRLRIEDESQEEPAVTQLIAHASTIINGLFPHTLLDAFGFNFDVYYRFNNVIPMKHIFENTFGKQVLKKTDLRDFGMQFSLDTGKLGIVDTYFLKVTAPLELVVHMNRHFPAKKIAPEKELKTMMATCYNEIDEIISAPKW